MAIIDLYSKEELEQIVKESSSIKEIVRKMGYSEGGSNCETVKNRILKYNINTEHFTQKKGIKRNEANVFIKDSTAGQAVLRKYYRKGNYTPYICAICGQEPFWQGKEMSLTLDHVNGDNKDDRLENLRWVCPNCDRQLDTFGTKNKRNIQQLKIERGEEIPEKEKNLCIDCGAEITYGSTRCVNCHFKSRRKVEDRPNEEELLNLLKNNNGNFTATAKMFNVTDNTIRKWCKAYNLPTHTGDYSKEYNYTKVSTLNNDEIVNAYLNCRSVAAVAKQFNISADSVTKVLNNNNIKILNQEEMALEKYAKITQKYSLDDKFIEEFSSVKLAALSVTSDINKIKGVASHISQACRNERKTAYGYKWKFSD